MNNLKNKLTLAWINIQLIIVNIAIDIIKLIIPLEEKFKKYEEYIIKMKSNNMSTEA